MIQESGTEIDLTTQTLPIGITEISDSVLPGTVIYNYRTVDILEVTEGKTPHSNMYSEDNYSFFKHCLISIYLVRCAEVRQLEDLGRSKVIFWT